MSMQSFTQETETKRAEEVQEQQSAPLTGKPMRRAARREKSAAAFRTISEVATELDVQQHVLRFWETKFSQIKPLKRGGGRRYYRPEDMALLRRIHHLLYTEGYTIKGVQKLLKEKGKKQLLQEEVSANLQEAASQGVAQDMGQAPAKAGLSQSQRATLQSTLEELKELRQIVKQD